MLQRTQREEYFLDLALRCAKQGTCIRRCYGSVLVDEYDTIVATGYTGTPKKKIHCIRCWRQEHNVPPGRNYEKCRSVHSEQNALIQAGKKARGCTLYLAGYDVFTEQQLLSPKPCYLCIKMLVNADVEKIVFKNKSNDIEIVYIEDMYKMIEKETFIQD